MNLLPSLPRTLVRRIRRSARFLLRRLHSGSTHYCVICDSHIRHLAPFGTPSRPNERCPVCGALARHWLDWLFIREKTDLLDGSPKRMLHVAPEPSLIEQFRSIPGLEYITGDLDSPFADVTLDLRDMPFPDEDFDVIYCSHVLEHIEEDRRAIAELRRVCRSTGWAILQVPITADRTFEDPGITEPDERHRVFGQFDHVRRCGPDYAERLDEGGFSTRTIHAREMLSPSECARHGIDGHRLIFYCRPVAADNVGPGLPPGDVGRG